MVFPSAATIVLFILITILIMLIGIILPKRLGAIVEITLVIVVLVYLFMTYTFLEATMVISVSSMLYSQLGMILNKEKRAMRNKLKNKLIETEFQVVSQSKDYKRIVTDIMLTVVVSAGAIVFLFFAPEMYVLLKLIIGLGLIVILVESIARLGTFLSTQLYWVPKQEKLFIISAFESRDLPLPDINRVNGESAPDLLKLHPLFTFMSSNQDYTQSFQSTLRLSFPGENIYIAPNDIEKWQQIFTMYVEDEQGNELHKVLPLWHPTNLKRLFWQGYFAVSVKGVSAYTGLLVILIWFEVPSYIMITFILIWWLFNLYVSDRVLIAGTDAVEVTEGEIYHRAQAIFSRAGIPKTKLYMIDSPIYNGLATGMNISHGTIMITKATAQLSISAVEAILAHEAIHVKNRDVLINQVARMVFFGLVALVVYTFFDQIEVLAENLFIFIPTIYILMMLFPTYLSFVSQWTEARADYFGAKLLEEGKSQMAEGLRELGNAQDKSLAKTFTYSTEDAKPMKGRPSIARGNWFFRIIEFQLQLHPPMYFRIQCLDSELNWRKTRTKWLIGRVLESLPDLTRR